MNLKRTRLVYNNKLFLILGIGLAIRLIWAFMRWEWLQVAIYDDAFYYFAIAKTIATVGKISADGITVTNGFHPLWLAIVTPIWLSELFSQIGALRAVMVIAGLFDMATAYFIFRLLLPDKRVALWGCGLYFLNPVVVVQSMSGMETPLVALLAVLWIYMVTRHKRFWKIGLVGGLLCLARTDMVFLVIAGYIYTWWIDRQIPLKGMIYTTLIVSPWLIWNYATFGTIAQASGSAYPWIFHDEWINWFGMSYFSLDTLWKLKEMLWASLDLMGDYFGGTIIFFIALFALISKKKMQFLLWALLGTSFIVFIHTFIRWFPRVWYFHTVYIVMILMLAPIIAQFRWRKVLTLCTIGIIGFIFVLANVRGGSGAFARAWTTQRRAMIATDIINSAEAGTVFGAWNSGYPQYLAKPGVTVINLDGLANNEVLEYYRDRRLMEYFDKMNITFVVDNFRYMSWSFGKYIEPEFRNRIELVKKIEHIGRENNDMCLFRINPLNGEE